MPTAHPQPIPRLPLDTSTDGGCDTYAPSGSPWTRQVDTLTIHATDYLISAIEGQSEQELINVLSKHGIKSIAYMGVHENMCLLARPFAIEKVVSWGFQKDHVAVIRELVDVMYTPKDPPYVAHAEGLRLHTEYIEKFWASTISMYDYLVPSYTNAK